MTQDPHDLSSLTAKSWLLFDKENNKEIYQCNAGKKFQIASLTKMMTALCVVKLAKRYGIMMSELYLSVPPEALLVKGTSAELESSDSLSVLDLLYGMMLPSGNDAAIALAHSFGAFLYLEQKYSERWIRNLDSFNINEECDVIQKCSMFCFIKEMNRMAQTLFMKDTSFTNPHGLPDKKNLSTCFDLILLSKEIVQVPLLQQIVKTQQYTAVLKTKFNTTRELIWTNTNLLLQVEGFKGIKTGITNQAGGCLATQYQFMDFAIYEKFDLMIIVLGCENSSLRFQETVRILNHYKSSFYKRRGKVFQDDFKYNTLLNRV